MTSSAPEEVGGKKHTTRRIVQLFVVLGLLAAVVFFGIDKLPAWADIVDALGSASPLLVCGGLLAAGGALVASALGQQVLTRTLGGELTLTRSVLISSAGSTIATAVPLGGPVSVAFTVRWLALSGISAATATAVAVIAGALSIIALCVMGLIGLISIWVPWLTDHVEGTLGYTAIVVTIIAAVRFVAGRGVFGRLARGIHRRAPSTIAGWLSRMAAAVRSMISDLKTLHTRVLIRTTIVLAFRWVFDIACLVCMTAAVGLNLEPVDAVIAYLTVQVTRQITILPGGVGIVEVALASALIVQGAAAGPAAAAVLLYRLASQWLPMLLGVGPLVWLMRRERTADAQRAALAP
ncbi:lysylphosphatidylglycerol synthase transmembrane domain-containing protein [Cumulibacter soli]|uniref:lysylphosphatidylglycerol synthase transmembrane domain-containing protein n=1 Tax=Cumulibacter soli TaxID=2546344 RepID=UPI0010687293|nr:lysylphosphatidylglycerol synthase transmembrane domain-containing protein [Cumulibacter soli]